MYKITDGCFLLDGGSIHLKLESENKDIHEVKYDGGFTSTTQGKFFATMLCDKGPLSSEEVCILEEILVNVSTDIDEYKNILNVMLLAICQE